MRVVALGPRRGACDTDELEVPGLSAIPCATCISIPGSWVRFMAFLSCWEGNVFHQPTPYRPNHLIILVSDCPKLEIHLYSYSARISL